MGYHKTTKMNDMSGLTVLLLVLPFPLAFVIHDLEEILFQHRWMLKNKESLSERFPKLRKLIDNLARMNTKAFCVAVLEELLVLLAVTAYVLCQGEYAKEAWVAVFIAFSFHLIVHVIQGIIIRGYIPGLVTSILLLPYISYGLWCIWLGVPTLQLFICSVAGIIFMLLNLRFSHWIGKLLFPE